MSGRLAVPSPPVSIRLLGPFQIEVEGRILPPGRSRKEQWLLALLLLRQGRAVERDWLAATLWPDSQRSRVQLRDTLYDLRQTLGAQAARLYSPTAQTLQVDLTGAEVDLLAFDACLARGDSVSLEQAVGLYRGALLEGCAEEWVYPEREAREHACLSALERLAEQALAAGETTVAIGYLQRLIAVDALRESAHCRLMEALAEQGNYAALMQVYRDLRLLLHRELHSEPSPETLALFQRLQVRKSRTPSAPTIPLPGVPSQPSHNLPALLTSFVGRVAEKEEVRSLLRRSRLLTLTGSGGCGKTRLSLQVAEEVKADFPDGVWLVELAALTEPDLVLRTVAGILGLKEGAGQSMLQTLLDALQGRRMLLVLDNCEHLLDACAGLAEAVLKRCPITTVLATSRERLGIGGEQIYRVPSLSLPAMPPPSGSYEKGTQQGMTPQTMMESEAVRLFLERAQATSPIFALTPNNAWLLARLCIRLDGIPLAIELAAAWVRSISLKAIHDRLDDSFLLLSGGSRTALPRQQTLMALIDWSYNLLSESEKTFFARLSVFVGGWSLDAAETVCRVGREETEDDSGFHPSPSSASVDTLTLLVSLVDKSLVVYTQNEQGTGRYHLLETIRQYASQKLRGAHEESEIRTRHRDYCLTLTTGAEAELTSSAQLSCLQRLDPEHDNLRAALIYCAEKEQGAEAGLQMAADLMRYWTIRGHYKEGRMRLERALERNGSPFVKARAFRAAGILCWYLSDFAAAEQRCKEALELFQDLGDRSGVSRTVALLGVIAFQRGDFSTARARARESLAMLRELGDIPDIANRLCSLGLVECKQGDYPAALKAIEEALHLFRGSNNKGGISFALSAQAEVYLQSGDYASARLCLEQCLEMARELGETARISNTIGAFGDIALLEGDFVTAQILHEETLRIRRELGDRFGLAYSLQSLGTLAFHQGDDRKAKSLYLESLQLHVDVGNSAGIVCALEAVAVMMANCSQPEPSVHLWAATTTVRHGLGLALNPADRRAFERSMAAARASLSEEAISTAWQEGQSLSLDQAVACANKALK